MPNNEYPIPKHIIQNIGYTYNIDINPMNTKQEPKTNIFILYPILSIIYPINGEKNVQHIYGILIISPAFY